MTDSEINDLREEVAYWRRDAVARAWSAAVECSNAGPTERSKIKVGRLDPALHAIRDADAKQWHMACEACGKALRTGQLVHYYEDAGSIHVDCDSPDAATPDEHSHAYEDGFSDDGMAKMLAYAREQAND
jgi:hypothetical protein